MPPPLPKLVLPTLFHFFSNLTKLTIGLNITGNPVLKVLAWQLSPGDLSVE